MSSSLDEKQVSVVDVPGPPRDNKNGKTLRAKPNKLLPFCERMRSSRWAIVWITWFGFINQTIMSNSFNMAIVCMTGDDPPPLASANSTFNFTQSANGSHSEPFSEGEFHWASESQAVLLSASMYISFLTPFVSGFLARKYGCKLMVGISVTLRSIIQLLTPLCARTHLYLLIGARVIGGSLTSTLTTATQGLWAHWAPDQEKVQIVAWTKSGVNIGTLLASLVSGFLCAIPIDNGWPFVFYVFGGISTVWCILWWILVYDTPEKHKWVSDKERVYIKANIRAKPKSSKVVKVPYKAILTSRPVFAYFVIQTVHKWCATIYMAYLPKYMRDVLRFDIEENAVVSSVPFAARFLGSIFWGVIADRMARKRVSTTVNRKIIQSTGFLTCAALTVATGFVDYNHRIVAVVLFVVNMFFQSCTFAAIAVVPLDMSPSHAGIICGIYQSAGNIVAMCGPLIVGYLTPDGTLEQWRSVFYMITATYILGVGVFALFGSAKIQPWDSPMEITIESPSESKEQNGVFENGSDATLSIPAKIPLDNKAFEPDDDDGSEVSPNSKDEKYGANMNNGFVRDIYGKDIKDDDDMCKNDKDEITKF